MTETLRDEIANVIRDFVEESRRMAMPKLVESRRKKLADRILALPAIAEALAAYERRTPEASARRIDELTKRHLTPSITTDTGGD